MNYFDPDARSPLAGQVPQFPDLRGGLVFVGVDGNSRWQFEPDTNNISPRVGGAFEVERQDRPARRLRARLRRRRISRPTARSGRSGSAPRTCGCRRSTASRRSGCCAIPIPTASVRRRDRAEGLLTAVGGAIQAPLRDGSPTPWNRQWNVTVQRELPWRVAAEVAYVGTAGHDLQTNTEGGLNLNQLDPQYLALGSALNQTVPNPFFGIVNSGVHVSPTISRAQLLRPYPQFTDIIPLQNTGATSIYHALQMSVNRRMSGGLLLAGSYAWSKAEEEGEAHQNSYDIAASRSVASYDIPHRLVLSALYEIPFGRGRRFGTNAPALLDGVLGGWQVNGIVTVQSGTPLTIYGEQHGRPVQPGDARQLERRGSAARRRRARIACSAGSTPSTFSQPAAFTFGNAGATFPLLRTDSVRNLDLSVFKHFSMPRRHAAAGAHRGVQRAQPRPVRIAEHQRDLELVRRRDVAGEHAAPAAVRPEGALVN